MAVRLQDALTEADFSSILKANKHVVVHFWAPWCEPCKQLDTVLLVLAEDHKAAFVRVEAEEATDLSIKYEISVVPLFLFFKDGKVVDKLEGADVPSLTSKVNKLCPAEGGGKAAASIGGTIAPTPASKQTDLAAATEKLKKLIGSQPVMLFMKGTPDAPRCGFSSRTVAALRRSGTPFGHFDILSDEAVRQAAKVYSDWPSYPQLYIRGDLVGGCDIVEEMDASGELQELLAAGSSGQDAQGGESLDDRLRALTTQADVVLFMKGTPDAPRCGFSSKVVQALRSLSVPFKSFDILEDQEVREGLKKFNQWPTFPQLIVAGELLGGCDIVLELQSEGKLKSEIESQIAAGKQ